MARRARGEGSIYRRKDGLWVAESLVGGRRKYLYAKTKKAAFEKKREYEEGNSPQTKSLQESVKFGDFITDWLSSIEGSIKERTYQRHEEVVRLHLSNLNGKRLPEIQVMDLQKLYQRKLQSLSSRSVEIIHRTVSKALKQAVRWGLVERNVAEQVTPPKPQPREITTLSASEVNKLFDAVRGRRFEALYVLAVTAGLRQGELLGLQWCDIDFNHKVLRVRRTIWKGKATTPKSRSSLRSVPLTEQALESLDGHKKACENGDFPLSEWVFSTANGTPVGCHNLLNRSWYPLLDELGLARIPFHNLRHTCATLLLENNVHPKLVQGLLGHSSIEITLDTYSHVIPEIQGRAAEAMDEALGS